MTRKSSRRLPLSRPCYRPHRPVRRRSTRSAFPRARLARRHRTMAAGATASRSLAAALNAKGGIMGRKIELVTEDNKSEPQEAVDGLSKYDFVGQSRDFPLRLRLGRQLRWRAAHGACANPDGSCSICCRTPIT